MTPEINMVSSIITGLGAVVVFGLLFKFQWGRLTKLTDSKADKEFCEERHAHIQKDLDKGSKRFDRIDAKLEEQTSALNELSTTTAVMNTTLTNVASTLERLEKKEIT